MSGSLLISARDDIQNNKVARSACLICKGFCKSKSYFRWLYIGADFMVVRLNSLTAILQYK